MELPEGQRAVGRLLDGATLTYEIDFGADSRHMAIYAASPLEGGLVEIRVGSADATTLWAEFKEVDPNEALVEINVRQSVFYPDTPGRDYISASDTR